LIFKQTFFFQVIVWKTNFDQNDADEKLIARPRNTLQNGVVEPPPGDFKQSPNKKPLTAPVSRDTNKTAECCYAEGPVSKVYLVHGFKF